MPADGQDSLPRIVADFLDCCGRRHAAEKREFLSRFPARPAAIVGAARCRDRNGSLHDHQYRLGYPLTDHAADFIAAFASEFELASDFNAIHALCERTVGSIDGVGELAVYDIAERIGWSFGVEPQQVYLHSGTLKGAKALFPALKGKRLAMEALPSAFEGLSAAEVENLFCICKTRIEALRQSGRLT